MADECIRVWRTGTLRAALRNVALTGMMIALWPTTGATQSASQITPHSLAPIQGNSQGGITIGEVPDLEVPPAAETLFVTLSSVSISADSRELTEIGTAFTNPLVGQRVSGAQIFSAARALETAYAKAGYVLARVILPPQELVDGASLRLRVVDGYIERIESSRVPARVRRRIEKLVGPLTGKRGLKLREIERRLLLASDTPGVILKSTLAPGTETGAAVLVIEARDQPVDVSISTDNSLSRSLGSYQLGLGAEFNSLLHAADLTYVRFNGDPTLGDGGIFQSEPRNRMLAAGVIVPLGTDGLTFNLEGTQSRTTPTAESGSQSTDEFERLSLRLRYPWIRSRDFNLASQFVFDAQNEHEDLVLPATLPLFDDRLRILRLMEEWNTVYRYGGSLAGSFSTSYGFDGLGARSAAVATSALPLSRQGAGASFTKVDGSLSYGQPILAHLNGELTARGQYAFGRALERSEQIGIADPQSLSAFDAGSLQGDSGYVVRGELSSPWLIANLPQASVLAAPYLFGAKGEVFVADPTSLEAPHVSAGSYGAGLRISGGASGSPSNGSLTLEYARESGGDVESVGRLRLSAAIRY
jgi:hemolysin activation/secretion protein